MDQQDAKKLLNSPSLANASGLGWTWVHVETAGTETGLPEEEKIENPILKVRVCGQYFVQPMKSLSLKFVLMVRRSKYEH